MTPQPDHLTQLDAVAALGAQATERPYSVAPYSEGDGTTTFYVCGMDDAPVTGTMRRGEADKQASLLNSVYLAGWADHPACSLPHAAIAAEMRADKAEIERLRAAGQAAFDALHANWDILGGDGDAASIHANELLTAALQGANPDAE